MFITTITTFSGSKKVYNEKVNEPREDYGCIHESHSKYDDGDSLNLEAASFSNNH